MTTCTNGTPKEVRRYEIMMAKYVCSLKSAFTVKMYESNKYMKLQQGYEAVCEKHNYTPNYSIADFCS